MNMVETKLARWARRRVWLDAFLLTVVALCGASGAAWAFGTYQPSASPAWIPKSEVALFAFVFFCYLSLGVLRPIRGLLAERVAPQWCIQECDGVVLVHGSVGVDEWGQVEFMMLALRPGYMPVERAWVRFPGVTMAAVPATAEYAESRTELKALGMSVAHP
ncbi:hypothetical protein [Ottowia sp.]|uniref:hypothetical protein n=1 Tax=Ottowia sp. TaxID=1898956 RepID=UPI0025EEA718|nr:hypothetical protein [Ottowia sp.]MBK6616601.1 hypothetical protein [Ottowia sp.]